MIADIRMFEGFFPVIAEIRLHYNMIMFQNTGRYLPVFAEIWMFKKLDVKL